MKLEIIWNRRSEILKIPFKVGSKMVWNSWKIDLWSCLGALWARSTPRAKNYEKSSILGWPMGFKMEQKSFRNLIKITLIFITISKQLFLDFGTILAPKTFPKWGVAGSLFQPRYEYAKSVILNNPSMVSLYFSILEALIFDVKGCSFQLFFRMRF